MRLQVDKKNNYSGYLIQFHFFLALSALILKWILKFKLFFVGVEFVVPKGMMVQIARYISE